MRVEREARRGLATPLATAVAVAMCMGIARADTATDDRIKQRILSKLTGQVSIHLEGFDVQVTEGVVRLRGSAGSLGEVKKVERIVGSIPDVAGIASELIVRPSPVSDAEIAGRVKYALDRRPRFKAAQLQVSSAGGQVTLDGTVERALDRLEAGEFAAEVEGVSQVINNLRIRSEGTISPEQVRSRVLSVLTNPLTFGVVRNLEVEVEGSTVTLYGAVSRPSDLTHAERLCLGVPGVGSVRNLIEVMGG